MKYRDPDTDQLKDELEDKLLACGMVARELEYDHETLKSEAARLTKRAQAVERNIERLKAYMLENMEATNVKQVKNPVVTVAVQASPLGCKVVDEGKVPSNFKVSVLELSSNELPEEMLGYRKSERIDKRRIIEEYKKGADVPGTQVERGSHVRVR
jgi:hypothetical protein